MLAGPAVAADARVAPIDVLMLGMYSCRPNDSSTPRFEAACAEQGIRLSIGSGHGIDYNRYTSEFLRQFQVVIFDDLPSEKAWNPMRATPEEIAAFRDRLDAYYQAGGGVIWSPMSIGHHGTYWNDVVGKRYDAQSLEEAIQDPGKELSVNSLDRGRNRLSAYIWTTNVTAHPVSEGVRGLFLPITGEWSWPGTVPMKFGKSWTTLVRGMDSTYTIGNAAALGSGHAEFKPEVKGTYAAAPEIVGVRDSVNGSGRMMVFPFFPAHTWLNQGNFILKDALMLNGFDGHASDGMKLFVNACKWLAVPAQKAGLGGYTPPPAPLKRPYWPYGPRDWSKVKVPDKSWVGGTATWRKGIIGVRTSLSDGNGTVKDYVTEAKKLGLSYIIFLENLEKIDAAGYAKLVADCKANSDSGFVALPGYIFRDMVDSHYYVFDSELLPEPQNMTPDRRVKSAAGIREAATAGGDIPGGIGEVGRMKLDPWYATYYSSIAAYTYDGGKLVDDGFPVYLSLQGRMHEHPPISLTIIRSPDELQKTVRDAHLTSLHLEELTRKELRERLNIRSQYEDLDVVVSNGPEIVRWGAIARQGLPFAAGLQRMRIEFEARSNDGLADVKIIDAKTGGIFRHFKPGGEKNFSCEMDETHKDEQYFVPLVTDIKGRTALGATLVTWQTSNTLMPYRDNNDCGHRSSGWDENHELQDFEGWAGGWHKYGYEAIDAPTNTFPEDLRIFGVDGGAIAGSHCATNPVVITGTSTEPKFPAYTLGKFLMSFDYSVKDYVGDAQFLVPTDPTKFTEPQVPTEYADILVRCSAVRGRYHAPFSANVHEVSVTFKKDCVLKRIEVCRGWRSFDWGPPVILYKDGAGEGAVTLEGEKKPGRRGILNPGDYVYLANDRAGACGVVNLGPGVLSYDGNYRTRLYIDGGNRPVKAGEKVTARYLVFTKPWDEDQTKSDWLDKFIADYAVGGGKPGYQYEVTQGKVKEINYEMTLNQENGGAMVAVKKYNLPHNLLVNVNGLAANAVAGRYDLDRKQLLILPVFEGTVTTSINTTRGDTRLAIGELFHCDDAEVMLSCVQDGADNLLLEVHNPTDKAKTVKLTGVPGFAPLSALKETVQVAPCSSVKSTLSATPGSLAYTFYDGD